MLSSKIILVGYSGHGFVVADAAIESGFSLIGYIDLEEKKLNPFGISYLGKEEDLVEKYWQKPYKFILGIGDNVLRSKVADNLTKKGGEVISIYHPRSYISRTATLRKGTFIAADAVINTLANLGENCIINSASVIEHECELGENVHVAPAAVLAGNVKVGKNSFIGANSVIKQGITIGDNVVIGAGTVVISDVPDNQTIVGNPAREIK